MISRKFPKIENQIFFSKSDISRRASFKSPAAQVPWIPRDGRHFLNPQRPRFLESRKGSGFLDPESQRSIPRNQCRFEHEKKRTVSNYSRTPDEPKSRNHRLVVSRARGSETPRYFALKTRFPCYLVPQTLKNFACGARSPAFAQIPRNFCVAPLYPQVLWTPPHPRGGGPRTSDREFLVM